MRLSLCSALVVMLALAATPLAMGTAKGPSPQRQLTLEQGILREVNHVRVARGLHPLTSARGLQAAASFQSRALLVQGVFEHDSAAGGAFGLRLRRFYPAGAARSWSVGENLLWAAAGLSPESAVQMWLDSPAHRRVLLDPAWLEFGVGAFGSAAASGVYASAGSVVVVTLDFGVRTGASR